MAGLKINRIFVSDFGFVSVKGKSLELNHDQYIEFKEKQFELFKRTKDYEELVSSLREQFKSSDIKVESFIKIYSTKYLTYFMED